MAIDLLAVSGDSDELERARPGWALSRCATSNPSMTGRPRSKSATSGRNAAAISRASGPLSATRMTCPKARSESASICAASALSSTTRIRSPGRRGRWACRRRVLASAWFAASRHAGDRSNVPRAPSRRCTRRRSRRAPARGSSRWPGRGPARPRNGRFPDALVRTSRRCAAASPERFRARVSVTVSSACEPTRRQPTPIWPPGSVYFAAFVNRLAMIWPRRAASPVTTRPRGTSTVSKCLRPSIAGLVISIALATISARSSRSRLSCTFPRVIRDTSSRSSTSDTRCLTWRSMIVRSRSAPETLRSRISCSAVRIGAKRVSQFVAEHGQELVLRAVRRFGLTPGVRELGHVEGDDRDARHVHLVHRTAADRRSRRTFPLGVAAALDRGANRPSDERLPGLRTRHRRIS